MTTDTPHRVLLVDDDEAILDLTRRALTSAGFRVDVAHGPFEVAGAVARFDPEVIVLDLEMPGLDGLKLSRFLRGARLILYSGATHRVTSSARASFEAVVPKERGAQELVRALREIRLERDGDSDRPSAPTRAHRSSIEG